MCDNAGNDHSSPTSDDGLTAAKEFVVESGEVASSEKEIKDIAGAEVERGTSTNPEGIPGDARRGGSTRRKGAGRLAAPSSFRSSVRFRVDSRLSVDSTASLKASAKAAAAGSATAGVRQETGEGVREDISAAARPPPSAQRRPTFLKSLYSDSARIGLADSTSTEKEEEDRTFDIMRSLRIVKKRRVDSSEGMKGDRLSASEPALSAENILWGSPGGGRRSASAKKLTTEQQPVGASGKNMSMHRVSDLLWDRGGSISLSHRYSSDTTPTKHRALFDPDRLADAAIAAEEEEYAEERAEWMRIFGQCCRTVMIAVAVIGVVAGITVVILVGTGWRGPEVGDDGGNGGTAEEGVAGVMMSGDGGTMFVGFEPSPDVRTVCAEDNIDSTSGYDACHELCEEAYCCFVPDWNTAESCAETQKDDCVPYHELCPLLDDAVPGQDPDGRKLRRKEYDGR